MCLYILGSLSNVGWGALVVVCGGLMAVWGGFVEVLGVLGVLGWFGVFQWTDLSCHKIANLDKISFGISRTFMYKDRNRLLVS